MKKLSFKKFKRLKYQRKLFKKWDRKEQCKKVISAMKSSFHNRTKLQHQKNMKIALLRNSFQPTHLGKRIFLKWFYKTKNKLNLLNRKNTSPKVKF